MASRSAWEPRWKYQAGRQVLCMHAAAEAALQGVWFDTPQPAHSPIIAGDMELDVDAMVGIVMRGPKPKRERGRPRKVRP